MTNINSSTSPGLHIRLDDETYKQIQDLSGFEERPMATIAKRMLRMTVGEAWNEAFGKKITGKGAKKKR